MQARIQMVWWKWWYYSNYFGTRWAVQMYVLIWISRLMLIATGISIAEKSAIASHETISLKVLLMKFTITLTLKIVMWSVSSMVIRCRVFIVVSMSKYTCLSFLYYSISLFLFWMHASRFNLVFRWCNCTFGGLWENLKERRREWSRILKMWSRFSQFHTTKTVYEKLVMTHIL